MRVPSWKLRLPVVAALAVTGLASLVPAAAQTQTAWRWVDKDGVVHYSDQPQPGATRVELQRSQAPQTAETPAGPPGQPGTPPAPPPARAPEPPATCAITSPVADQVFVAVESVTIAYAGPAGGTARLLLNGQAVQRVASGTAFVVSPISRGTWSAVVAIEGAGDSGTQACQTAPVAFYVRQPSVINRPPPRPQPR
jgi:hypothetical protein